MTARSIRRAAERRTKKLERKAMQTQVVQEEYSQIPPVEVEEPVAIEPAEITPARLEANRANAQLSTGPKSSDGKAISSRNALTTALTGRTVLLPSDDAARYERHLAHYDKLYGPVGDQEKALVQSLADTMWRLDRIPGLEEALYIKGCNEFVAQVTELDPQAQSTMLRMHTYLAYERQFRNLNIQEMRLFRQREKLIAEIARLQKERSQKEKDGLDIASKLYIKARADRKPFNHADYGFEFSTGEVEDYLEGVRAAQPARKTVEIGNFPPRHANAA